MKFKHLFLVCTSSILLLSCSEYQKLLKSPDTDKRLNAAKQYYQKGDLNRSLRLLEPMRMMFSGTKKGEDITYMMAKIYHHKKNYSFAAEYYGRLHRNYPKSEKAEECAFNEGLCYFIDSPVYSVDQSYTYKSIDNLQEFIEKYPKSEKLQEANNMILELLNKLQRKSFEIAKGYHKIRDYQASMKAMDNFLNENPGTIFKEEALFLKFESAFLLASNSIESKEKQRFEDAKQMYESFVKSFPESQFKEKADKMYKETLEKLNKLQ